MVMVVESQVWLVFLQHLKGASINAENQMKLLDQIATQLLNSRTLGRSSSEGSVLGNKWSDFQNTKPPVKADDWIRDIERKLNTVQYNDHEKVLYASHQLTDSASAWWSNYEAMHANKDTITWAEFVKLSTMLKSSA
uniref:Retrotransposon gag domain-containing protein n=1 Tax=Oryza brachyantha TaxID=4533 RepID=J3N9X4_ORYBR